MHDDRDDDPVTAANLDISDFIRGIGGRITPDRRPEYERLLDAYFEALGAPRAGRNGDASELPRAA